MKLASYGEIAINAVRFLIVFCILIWLITLTPMFMSFDQEDAPENASPQETSTEEL